MVKQVLVALFALIAAVLILTWVLSGGPRRIITGVQDSFHAASAASDNVGFRLPWQPAEVFPNLDITDLLDIAPDGEEVFPEDEKSTADRLQELEAEYDRLRGEASRRPFGTPSPYAGKIGFATDYGVRASDPREETLQITANYTNTEPINISGWTLQSALTASSIQIPFAASPFIQGGANAVGTVSLDPGAIAILVSGHSPVGLSFRENMCIGYLQQFQNFEPPLLDECPSASSILPLTERNLQQYGEGCFDAITNLPQCHFPQHFSAQVTPACRAFLTDALSYNGCVRDNRFRAEFQKNAWRLFLGAGRELWGNGHDAIRLLDSDGRTVSVFVY